MPHAQSQLGRWLNDRAEGVSDKLQECLDVKIVRLCTSGENGFDGLKAVALRNLTDDLGASLTVKREVSQLVRVKLAPPRLGRCRRRRLSERIEEHPELALGFSDERFFQADEDTANSLRIRWVHPH